MGADRDSDADVYATAEMLVALNQAAGVPLSDARMQRGIRFLLDAQLPDGSWHVRTRRTRGEGLPYFETGYPHGEDQFISYAGAAWATMALTLATREGRSTALMDRPARRVAIAPDGSDTRDVTPLMWAAWRGSAADMQRLLAAGASVHDTTASGVTPLMFAARDAAKVRLLLDAGADPNALSPRGYSPLMIATASSGGNAAALLLLERGARADVAARAGSFERVTPMIAALVRGDTGLAQQLVTRGANVRGAPDASQSPLLVAAYYGDGAITRWLIARGVPANATPSPSDSTTAATPLMMAAEDGSVDVVRALLDAGARVDDIGPDGYTALQIAAATIDRGNTEIVELLLKAGANAGRVAKDGETALSLARRWGSPRTIALIESAARR